MGMYFISYLIVPTIICDGLLGLPLMYEIPLLVITWELLAMYIYTCILECVYR